MSTPSGGAIVWRLFRWALAAAALVFCARYLVQNFAATSDALERVSVGRLLLSVALALLGMLMTPGALFELYRDSAPAGSSGRALVPLTLAFCAANIFKYVPGRVSTAIVLVDDSGRRGLDRPAVAQALLAINALSVALGGAAGLVCLAAGLNLDTKLELSALSLALGLLAAGALAFAIVPSLNAWGLRLALRLARKEASGVRPFAWTALLRCTAWLTAMWVLLAASYAFLVDDVMPLNPAELGWVALSYPAAHAAGLVAFVAPAGVGVRDGVLAGFLTRFLDGAGQAAVAPLVLVALHRAVWAVSDVALLAVRPVGALWARRQQGRTGG